MIDSSLMWKYISELDIWLFNGVMNSWSILGGVLGTWHGRKTYGLGFLDRVDRIWEYMDGLTEYMGTCMYLAQSLAFSLQYSG